MFEFLGGAGGAAPRENFRIFRGHFGIKITDFFNFQGSSGGAARREHFRIFRGHFEIKITELFKNLGGVLGAEPPEKCFEYLGDISE